MPCGSDSPRDTQELNSLLNRLKQITPPGKLRDTLIELLHCMRDDGDSASEMTAFLQEKMDQFERLGINDPKVHEEASRRNWHQGQLQERLKMVRRCSKTRAEPCRGPCGDSGRAASSSGRRGGKRPYGRWTYWGRTRV